jgi:hypothetical protein
MSESLKAGDVCLLVGGKHEAATECWPYLGKEVTLDRWDVIRKMWDVHAADGYEMHCEEKHLLKKKPPKLGAWGRIQQITGWKPAIPEHVKGEGT